MKNFLAVSREYFKRIMVPSLEERKRISPPTVKHYVIADKRIAVHLYGREVANIFTLALAHNETHESFHADLTIHAWDSKGAATEVIPPWNDSSFEKDAAIDGDSFLGVYVGGEESLNFYDKEKHVGYFWTQDASQLPDWVLGAPFRTIFHWFFSESRIHFIHGAVVGQDGISVLLTAKSGSGKSTTALSSILSGMDYLGDDYVAIETADKVMAHSLYHSAKVTREGLTHFPEFAEKIWNKDFGEREKAVIFLSDIFPEQVKRASPLRAVLIPRITSTETRIVRASKMEAMIAIAPTTLFQLPLAETNKIAMFKEILEKIPCYFLDLGPDVRTVPDTIKSFLKSAMI